jgi:S-adenosylmethionine:tRNA ribosyltransferase-isomerase
MGGRLLRFAGPADPVPVLARLGEVPLPPYIHAPLADEADYQTVYASAPGASAAPTAGLHFTPEVMEAIRGRAHAVAFITLHVGVGTFRPIRTENVEEHQMQTEHYAIGESTANLLTSALAERRRIVAVGTSTVRALEAATCDGSVRAGSGQTDLFIRPGYSFRSIGALLTNFHLPRSTLLLLVSAFADGAQLMRAYQEAMEQRYRFLSFGDGMLIL